MVDLIAGAESHDFSEKQINRLNAVPMGVIMAVEVTSCVSRAAEPLLHDSGLEFTPQWVDLEMATKDAELMVEHTRQNMIPNVVKQGCLHLDWLLSLGPEFFSSESVRYRWKSRIKKVEAE